MAKLATLQNLTRNPNVRQYLDFIAWAEGVQHGYNTLLGNDKFSDFSRHPDISKGFTQTDGKANTSDAAGRYQFMGRTWQELQKRYGFRDFSPQSQDMGAVALMIQNGALPHVLKGDFKAAISKSGGTWASLPTSTYKQGKKSWQQVQQYFSGNASRMSNQRSQVRMRSQSVGMLARQAIFGGKDFAVTSNFGGRKAPVAGASTYHNGLDIGAGKGTPIYAVEDGIVGGNQGGKGGNQLWLNGGSGYRYGFAHLDKYAVPLGSRVKKGDLIAYSGDSGIGTGAHVHFTVTDRDGKTKLDPATFRLPQSSGYQDSSSPNYLPPHLVAKLFPNQVSQPKYLSDNEAAKLFGGKLNQSPKPNYLPDEQAKKLFNQVQPNSQPVLANQPNYLPDDKARQLFGEPKMQPAVAANLPLANPVAATPTALSATMPSVQPSFLTDEQAAKLFPNMVKSPVMLSH